VAVVAVLMLLVEMQVPQVVSVEMEDQVRLQAHLLVMQAVAVVEVDPIPIRQLLAAPVVRAVAVPERHRRDSHVLLKMEQMEVRT
jgi:hypothetical protein